MSFRTVIWQYWETQGRKPAFIDDLYDIARRNAGAPIERVTPDTLFEYLPDLEPQVLEVAEVAHRADMIRTRLLQKYGGMWLDSDAVVLRDLRWMFDLLDQHEFIGFNDGGRLAAEKPFVRVCCFLSRAGGTVVSRWVEAQGKKLGQMRFDWNEIGAAMLNPICLQHAECVCVLPFESISPVGWREIETILEVNEDLVAEILPKSNMVMLSNQQMRRLDLDVLHQSVDDIVAGESVLSHVLRQARSGPIQ
jgi:hypothetical protein